MSIGRDISLWRENMSFIFEWQERQMLFLLLEHKIHIFEQTCKCSVYGRHTDDGVSDDFAKISDHFPKIFQSCSEGVPEHFRRLPKTFEDDPKMFRSYTNEFIKSTI